MRIAYLCGKMGWWQEDKPFVSKTKTNALYFVKAMNGESTEGISSEVESDEVPQPHSGCHVMSSTGQSLEIFENEDGSFRIVSNCVESVSIIKKKKTIKISEKIRKLRFDGPKIDIPAERTEKWEEIHISTECGDPDSNMSGD